MAKLARLKRDYEELVAENDALDFQVRQLTAALDEAWAEVAELKKAASGDSAGTTAKSRGKSPQAGRAGA